MNFFEQAAELMRMGVIYLVDVETGEYDEFTAEEYEVIGDIVKSGRFKPQMSLAATLALSAQIKARQGSKN